MHGGTRIKWKGFTCPNFVRKLLARFRDVTATSSLAFSAWAIAKAPSSWIQNPCEMLLHTTEIDKKVNKTKSPYPYFIEP